MSAPRLLLVRHGESAWNRRGLVQGQTSHVPLTSRGHRQAARAAELLRDHEPTQVWTSDLLRARQTAHHIAAAVGLDPEADPRLRERSYGRDEGRPVGQVPATGRPDLTSEGGETFVEVVTRVGSFLQELPALAGPVVVVTHGDTLRAALAWLGLNPDRTVANGCVVGPLPLLRDPSRSTMSAARHC